MFRKVQVSNVGQEYVRYQIRNQKAMVAEVTRATGSVVIPSEWEGKPVTGIAKKAFLGCRKMTELVLPSTITTIEDYAFASCQSLATIRMPRKLEYLGRNVFYELRNLKQIVFSDTLDNAQMLSELSYLCRIMMLELSMDNVEAMRHVGDKIWWEQFDHYLSTFIRRSDEEGFSPFWAGGEEDYEDANIDLNYYCRERRIQKIICILERLLFDDSLSDRKLDEYLMYLRTFTRKPMEEESLDEPDEITEVLLRGGQRTMRYYALYEKYDLIHCDNIQRILSQIPDEQVELRSILLKKKQEYGTEEFWNVLSL